MLRKSMFSIFCIWVAVGTLLACSSANPIETSVDYKKTYQFSSAETYEFFPNNQIHLKNPRIDSKVLSQILENEIQTNLDKKKFQFRKPKDRSMPKMYVAYDVWSEKRKEVQTKSSMSDLWSAGGDNPSYLQIKTIEEGTLMIAIVDPVNNQVVWKGTAKGAIDWKADAKKRRKRIEETVATILKDFPPDAEPLL